MLILPPILQVWPQKEFPLIPYGKFTLNRNPSNYFTDVEQMAFAPANFIPGIEASPDKMLQVTMATTVNQGSQYKVP